MTDIAEQIRARQAAAAREGADHEKPLLAEVEAILAEMAVLTARLDALTPQLLTAYVTPHLRLLSQGREAAAKSVVSALSAVDAVLGG